MFAVGAPWQGISPRQAPFRIVRALESGVQRADDATTGALTGALSCQASHAAGKGDRRTRWSCTECGASRRTHSGFCATTQSVTSNCERDERGSWDVLIGRNAIRASERAAAERLEPRRQIAQQQQRPGRKSLGRNSPIAVVDLETCIQRCRACTRCRYVSFSQKLADCSWYHACNLTQLNMRVDFLNTSAGFRTVSMDELQPVPNLETTATTSGRSERRRAHSTCEPRSVVFAASGGAPSEGAPATDAGAHLRAPSGPTRAQVEHLARYFGPELSGLDEFQRATTLDIALGR